MTYINQKVSKILFFFYIFASTKIRKPCSMPVINITSSEINTTWPYTFKEAEKWK